MTLSSILDLLVSFFRKSLLLVNAMRHSFELEIVIGRPVEVAYGTDAAGTLLPQMRLAE